MDASAFRDSLATLQATLYNNAAQALAASVKAAETSAKATTLYKDRSGRLRANTRGSSSGLTGRIVADTEYAGFVNSGTRPHVIEARGQALAFVVAGEYRFARRVNHPGTAERPFMQVARDLGEQTLDYGLEFMVRAA